MQFQLNSKFHDIDPVIAKARILGSIPDPIRTHWVEIDGRRWPAKQAFEVATGINRSEFISHEAVRLLARMGFTTSELPRSASTTAPRTPLPRPAVAAKTSAHEALSAFITLDRFLQEQPLTAAVADLEAALARADLSAATQVAVHTNFGHDIIEAALIVRERVGMLDSLIHAAVITQTIPLLLEEGEHLVKRPSLAAGNDPERIYDLETNRRVAEFKVAQWKGADGLRQRGLVADLVGLAMDESGRRRQLFVVGELPTHFLRTSQRTVFSTLSKSSMRVRRAGLVDDKITVAELTHNSGVEIIDLAHWFPQLQARQKPPAEGRA